ncbi:hypothetical protein E2C01_056584 [Portunus trituberculatus]|uniref:Uncharacterized protein n=1 Tax=Portunus trituberculatus TaxID=210409 RepID=A0A5B7GY32_PORTR|nr:hypothetical protein [Portunus trituberculatus]
MLMTFPSFVVIPLSKRLNFHFSKDLTCPLLDSPLGLNEDTQPVFYSQVPPKDSIRIYGFNEWAGGID